MKKKVLLGMAVASAFMFAAPCVLGATIYTWLTPDFDREVVLVKHDPGATKVALPPAIKAPLNHIDPSLEGKRIQITGKLAWPGTARDPLTGMAHPGELERSVEVFGWKARKACGHPAAPTHYFLDWQTHPIAPKHVDPERVRGALPEDAVLEGEAPTAPFGGERFSAGDFQVGAYRIAPWQFMLRSPWLSMDDLGARPLPPEFIERFPEAEIHEDAIYLQGYRETPRHGDVRIKYVGPESIPTHAFTITGYQRGDAIEHGIPLEDFNKLTFDDPDRDLYDVTVAPATSH
jgi:hypothetical protein